MNDKDLQQIERYLAGELKDRELQNFEARLNTDQEFYDSVLAQQHINNALNDKGLWSFMKILKKVEANFYTKKNQQQPTYSLQQLLQFFGIVPDYEREIANQFTTRAITKSSSHQPKLLTPQNGIDCSNKLTFTLQTKAVEPLTLVIENSQEDEVGQYHFSAQTASLEVDIQHFLPGRYYWKLFGDTVDTIWGFFFIHKDLMPEKI